RGGCGGGRPGGLRGRSLRVPELARRSVVPRTRGRPRVHLDRDPRSVSAPLRIGGLSASRGERVLFDGLDRTVAPGDVIGLVGANGAGKSTLLTTLAGVGDADVTGSVILSPPDATIGYLAQEPERVPGETILG